MTNTATRKTLFKNKLFRTGLFSTLFMFLACLATHILTIAGLAGAIAYLGEIEHALLFAVLASAALTIYAAFRHRQCTRGSGGMSGKAP